MEYIVTKDKLYVIGKTLEIKEFFKEKTKLHRTLKDFIISEMQSHEALIKRKTP